MANVLPPKGYIAVGKVSKALSDNLSVRQGIIYANVSNLVLHIHKRHPDLVANIADLDSFVKKTLCSYSEISKTSQGGIMLISRQSGHSPISIAKFDAKFNAKTGYWLVRSIWIKNNSKLPKKVEKLNRKPKKRKNR